MMKLIRLAFCLTLALSISACDWFDDDDDDVSGGAGETQSAAQPSVQAASVSSEDTIEYTDNYHHWNPRSWDGRGSSLVLCSDAPKYDSCEIDGRPLRLHGNRDKGRYIWTAYYKKGLKGNIICRDGDRVDGFRASSSSKMQFGDC
ncbi:hypothetical protein [Desulfopila sp. IMCC35008]|uniref:hypothetical protein n=1 Tax=Desulfopila sp. IMCC35008 TaxID=2653858 RepID=UPI0013D3FB27|nr:hypothetical protein [Desulfopila sp. IMCC35008]